MSVVAIASGRLILARYSARLHAVWRALPRPEAKTMFDRR